MKTISLVRSQSKANERLNQLATRHETLKGQVAELTAELDSVKEEIHQVLDESGRDAISSDAYSCSRSWVNRESFSLVEARKVVAESTLNPFIKGTTYRQLRVQQKAAAVQKKAA